MPLNLSNFLLSKKEKSKMADFQDLDHIDGVSVSTTSANLYNNDRDDLVLFYFRHGAEHASVYTQSPDAPSLQLPIIFFPGLKARNSISSSYK